MRICKINNYAVFTGIRQDRNTVSQLKQDNQYDLNLPNQRRISNAIDELAKQRGEDNINFLLDVSENLRYGTNIDLGKKSFNDWRTKLNNAAIHSYNISDKNVQEKLAPKISKIINKKREISSEEKEILIQRDNLVNLSKKEFRNLGRAQYDDTVKNLDYFIISSEVPTTQKLYILKKLNYLMSDDYKINPQLKDKKAQVLSEIVNDIVIDTPESKIPNIKMVNQKLHGMCVAISICRKALAYEDKANYVDMILSELDDSEYMQVYDRFNLGQHKKVPVPKADIDYNYASEIGYRIIDASVMNWMNVADTAGAFNDSVGAYSTFDKNNFGTFDDTHIHRDIDDETAKYQDYYRACAKAKKAVISCKKNNIKQKIQANNAIDKIDNKIDSIKKHNELLEKIIYEIDPNISKSNVRSVIKTLLSLQVNSSDAIQKADKNYRKYSFVKNEEAEAKALKIKKFLKDSLGENINQKVLDKKSLDILDIVSSISDSTVSGVNTKAVKYNEYIDLYSAAAAYRTLHVFSLDIPENLSEAMAHLNIPDNETYLIENLENLSKNIRSGKINPVVKEALKEKFNKEILANSDSANDISTDEILADILDEYANNVCYITTTIADDLYHHLLAGGKKENLFSQLAAVRAEISENPDKSIIENSASILNIKPDKNLIIKTLDKYIKILNDSNCTDEQYNEIMNRCGHKSNLLDIKQAFDSAFYLMFQDSNPDYIMGFNLVNGLPADADISLTKEIYSNLAKNFNNVSLIIKTLQDELQITDEKGIVLNSADPKYGVLKKMENMGDLPTEKELADLRDKFNAYYRYRYADDGSKVSFKDIPTEITSFTPFEKKALSKYKSNINSWYATSTRRLNEIYIKLKTPLEELNREIGVQTGNYWVRENDSGLMDNQAVKIFEHMTDRPYYQEENSRKGVEHIKNSPYSGSSMSSVSDTRPAMHGQYVVDVKPVKMQAANGIVEKEVIFHDNTWGASEHENVWKDKYGLERTDYSSGRGGRLGYITNEKYQNGNLAENLIDKKGIFKPNNQIQSKMYKKLSPDAREEYSFPMLEAVILQGVSPKAMSTVKSIKQNLLLPSSTYVDPLTKYAQNMSTEELEYAFKRIEKAGSTSRKLYKDFLEQIIGDGSAFNKGIDSAVKYNMLDKNDKLRLMCEKVALIQSYEDIPDIKTYNIEVKSQKDLQNLYVKLRKSARENFDYIVAKNSDIIKFGAEGSRKIIYKELKQMSEERDLDLKPETMVKIVNSMKKNSKKDFDGSINHTIDLMIKAFEQSLVEQAGDKIPDADLQKISANVRKILEKTYEVTPEDVKTYFNSGRLSNFAAWIDKEFQPKSDEEFANILTQLRNMSSEEFRKKYNSKISDEDMGISHIDGYDIVKMIRGENTAIKNSFINTVFSEGYYKDIEESKIKPYYDLKKYSRNMSSGTYVNNVRSFDDLYSDFYFSLSLLNLKNEFDKYKDDAFRKYSVLPAYPYVEITSEESLEESMENLYRRIDDYIDYVNGYKGQMKSLEKIKELKNYMLGINPKGELSTFQYNKINKMLNALIAANNNDPSLQTQLDVIKKLMATESKSAKEYNDAINSFYDEFMLYEKTADNKTMQEAADITLKNIDTFKKTFIVSLFSPKYQGKAFELLNKWISARYKAKQTQDLFDATISENSSKESHIISQKYASNLKEADKYYEQFKDLFMKHRIISKPEELLKEYLLLYAKDAHIKGYTLPLDDVTKQKELDDIRSTYKSNLEGLLYKADLMELQDILMGCAHKGNLNAVSDAFKKSTIELKDGSVVSLDSDEGLTILLTPMLSEKNLETASVFINQLGLSERVSDLIVKNNPLEPAYKSFNRIQSILKSADDQAKFARDEFRKLGNFDDNPGYEQLIIDYKQRLLAKINRTNYRGAKEIYSAAIDDALNEIKKYPDRSKTLLLGANIDLAISGMLHLVQSNIDVLNQYLAKIQISYDLLEKLQFPENSEKIEPAQKFVNDFKKLLEYEYNTPKSYPNIGIYSK